VILCEDDELGYVASRTRFAAGQGLVLDETYRLAHLPLVAPDHPRVIARDEGRGYDMGRHEPVTSLVVPVPGETLRAAPAMREFEAELRTSPFADKIAWHILPRRQDRLHATLGRPRPVGPAERDALASLGAVTVELRGLFSGNVNVGRLYLRAYPEKREGMNVFHRIQQLLDCPPTDLYVVGLYNLIDDLDPAEATALATLIERWWNRPILRFSADSLRFLSSADDLVLSAKVTEVISLRK
jgi:hypothetical protein